MLTKARSLSYTKMHSKCKCYLYDGEERFTPASPINLLFLAIRVKDAHKKSKSITPVIRMMITGATNRLWAIRNIDLKHDDIVYEFQELINDAIGIDVSVEYDRSKDAFVFTLVNGWGNDSTLTVYMRDRTILKDQDPWFKDSFAKWLFGMPEPKNYIKTKK